METGIAYIITNKPGAKHKAIFEALCNKSIKYARKNTKLPIALASVDSKKAVKADYHIDALPYVKQYEKGKELHGLITAELIKTHICDWSPFKKTLYIDCDAFVVREGAEDYLAALDHGFDISLATCITQDWKDCVAKTNLSSRIIGKVPRYFPYWNFGVFGISSSSKDFMRHVREHYLSYCYGQKGRFMSVGGVPHAQPALLHTALELAPNHRIFTMPARYNCHYDINGGYVFNEKPIIAHMWKDIREMMI